MSIILFIVILAVLIIVHELGHFFVAKFFGIRVDEFGLGYPPRAKILFKKAGTIFSLNWIPFGGFVKIFGENPNEATEKDVNSFTAQPRHVQAAVLVAGIFCNLVFAWLLISLGFMVGLPTSVDAGLGEVKNPVLVLTHVNPGSPAEEAGLKTGDVIRSVSTKSDELEILSPETLSRFVTENGDVPITVSYSRGKELASVSVVPKEGALDGEDGNRKAIGIGMDMIGTLRLPIHKAVWEGLTTTVFVTKATAVGLGTFVADAFRGQSDLSQVAGPVGIVGLVGDVSRLGFIYVLSFTAFISINLAVINLIPFPALDGGRLLFVAIESVIRRPIHPKIANSLNLVGFGLLILLMVVVTVSDIYKLL